MADIIIGGESGCRIGNLAYIYGIITNTYGNRAKTNLTNPTHAAHLPAPHALLGYFTESLGFRALFCSSSQLLVGQLSGLLWWGTGTSAQARAHISITRAEGLQLQAVDEQ